MPVGPRHDLVESMFQHIQKEDGNGTAVARDHGTTTESQVLSTSSAPSTFEVFAANAQGPVGSGDGEETVPGVGRISGGNEIDGILAEMAQGIAPALALSSVGDGSQVPLPGGRTVAGMADGIRSGDSWSEDEQSLPGRGTARYPGGFVLG